MIEIEVRTNDVRTKVIKDTSTTPAEVFGELGINVSGTMVNLDGKNLSATELGTSFASLGVADGTTVGLRAIIKADGGKY